jgi:hypothetical protein
MDQPVLTAHDFRYYARVICATDPGMAAQVSALAGDDLDDLAVLNVATWVTAEAMGWDLETAVRQRMAALMRHGPDEIVR